MEPDAKLLEAPGAAPTPGTNHKVRPAAVVLALFFLLALAQHVPFSLLTEQRDAGELLLTARDLLAGRLPYTTTYLPKTPGAAYLIAAALAVGGHSLLAVRLLVLLANVVTALGTAALCRALGWSARTAAVAALIYLFAAPQFEGAQVLTEPFLAACAVFGLWAFVRGLAGRSLGWLVAAGAACAAAVWIKQVGVLVLAPALLTLGALFVRRAAERRWLVLAGAALAGGFVLTLGGLIAAAVRPDNVEAFLHCTVFGLAHRPPANWHATVQILVLRVVELPGVWLPALWVVVVPPRLPAGERPPLARPLLFLGAAVIVSLAPVAHRQFPHYFLPALPFAAVLAAVGWAAAVRRLVVPRKPVGVAVFGLLLVAALVPPALGLAGAVRDLARGATVFGDLRAASRMRDATDGRPFLIVPADVQYYFLCGVEPPFPELYFYEENLRQVPSRLNRPRQGLVADALREMLADERISYVLVFGEGGPWEELSPDERARWQPVTDIAAWTYNTRAYTPITVRVFRRRDV